MFREIYEDEINRSTHLSSAGAILGTGLIAVGGLIGHFNGLFAKYPFAFDATFILFLAILVPALVYFVISLRCVPLLYKRAQHCKTMAQRLSETREAPPNSEELDRLYLEAAREYASVNGERATLLTQAVRSLAISLVLTALLSVPFSIRQWCNQTPSMLKQVPCFCEDLDASHTKVEFGGKPAA